MITSEETSVSKSIVVQAPIERAFRVFTEDFDSWWPRTHHIATAEMAKALLEPRVGGRWYEQGVDGSECDWGRVLAWDPPRHVAFSWHLNGAFQYEADPSHASRVDVRFTDEGDGATRVELIHSELDRHGDGWTDLRDGVSGQGGWPELMSRYGQRVAAA
ncbi:MAG TPA: SRPBCC family protein [Acidimicrobiia bacterium]|jgi:uncharacterized protein YndB with AHSA1/START domain|nr:SRPBCC family protein [Acidimicrobiia bacterium]